VKGSFDTIEVVFGLFFCATIAAICFGAYLITELRNFPEEYRRAGSPSRFWNDGRTWSFLWYVLTGRFAALPEPSLVVTFQVFRAFEVFRLLLLAVFFLLLVA